MSSTFSTKQVKSNTSNWDDYKYFMTIFWQFENQHSVFSFHGLIIILKLTLPSRDWLKIEFLKKQFRVVFLGLIFERFVTSNFVVMLLCYDEICNLERQLSYKTKVWTKSWLTKYDFLRVPLGAVHLLSYFGSTEHCGHKSDRYFGSGEIRTHDSWVRSESSTSVLYHPPLRSANCKIGSLGDHNLGMR